MSHGNLSEIFIAKDALSTPTPTRNPGAISPCGDTLGWNILDLINSRLSLSQKATLIKLIEHDKDEDGNLSIEELEKAEETVKTI